MTGSNYDLVVPVPNPEEFRDESGDGFNAYCPKCERRVSVGEFNLVVDQVVTHIECGTELVWVPAERESL